ncbi:PfkB family carbohydrate kinase [Anaerosacchariphilus polymeriproducens]|uniref:Carbohydrate kinase n=1 Tax=Anaerosacchariphilus polymeriproducens TaxID=1812858 RepID=A0A371AWT8_9FIRM|nr:PfkB family carbohydrate kinase [Anaerosacchariphilus polymeriproducens]RDU24045.1 carbohydrate kinase [Anaerosacchariphilus polymeriproducens]
MEKYDVAVLGFGDNVVDKYEHIKTMYPGGNCVNFAVYAKRFGTKRSAYMGYFGNDAEAEHVIDTLRKEEIETVKCKQLEGENGCARATLVDGDRVFLGSNEGGIRGETPFILDQFDIEYMKQFDIVHSGNYCFTEKELKKIKKAGIYISFDFSDDSEEEYYKQVSKDVDFAFCSFEGTDEEVKEHLKKIISYGPKLATASRGAKGCILYDGREFFEQPAVPLSQVVDTMGAGDSLITAFLVGYIARLKNNADSKIAIRESLKEAAEFAASICGIEGAFGYGKLYE